MRAQGHHSRSDGQVSRLTPVPDQSAASNLPDSASPAPRVATIRGETIAALAIVGIAIVFAVGRPLRRRLAAHPSAAECAALLDRYVDHLAHAADPHVPAATVAEAQETARAKAATEPDFARCTTTLTREEADCAMRANGADEFERC